MSHRLNLEADPVETIRVEVQDDYLEREARSRGPIRPLAELVWNSLDADADEISLSLSENEMGGIDRLEVRDNGHGMLYERTVDSFGKLGGSWKRRHKRTHGERRLLHGEAGRGRIRAFGLGDHITWETVFEDEDSGRLKSYSIEGRADDLTHFEVSDLEPVGENSETGTTVIVRELAYPGSLHDRDWMVQRLTEEFALYLREYPNVRITYDGEAIEPSQVEAASTDYELEIEAADGRLDDAVLSVIEWDLGADRKICLCDEDGFTLSEAPSRVHAKGFDFTAYLKSELIREFETDGVLDVPEMEPVAPVVEQTRDKLRDHFQMRKEERKGELLEEWKREGVYPYEGQPQDSVERMEREVFDVVALEVNSGLKKFEELEPEYQRLSFQLIRESLETDPGALQKILGEVLQLPEDRKRELAELLEHTTLEAVVNASRVVADRLTFLEGLKTLLFNPELKEVVQERAHLHRLVARHTWLFGEEFHLSESDSDLTKVLKAHVELAERNLLDASPVRRADERRGIVDLMFSRRIPHPDPKHREHLVVELKRPNKKIDGDVVEQLKSYAFGCADDDRFRDADTRWEWWALSNDLHPHVEREANQRDRPKGLIFEGEDNIRLWVKTWSEVIEDAEARLRFFQKQLEYRATEEGALEFLQSMHREHLPEELAEA